MRVRGLFFDLGGTLFTYKGRLGGGGLRHVIEELGIRAEPKDIGKAWQKANAEVMQSYAARPYFLHRDLFEESLKLFLESFDKSFDDTLLDAFHHRQIESLVKHLPIRDECHEALAAMKSQGLYLSIVSNIDDDQLNPLVAKHKLDTHLTHWTSSEEARSCKPDAGIFHYALEKSGLGLEDVLFVGDSLHHDVAGADAVGMRSVRIVEEGITTPLTHGLEVTAEPTYEVSNLLELAELVEQINGQAA